MKIWKIFNGLGCIKGTEYKIDLKPGAVFVNKPARAIPSTIREAVKKELDHMEKLGVIKQIKEPTAISSPLVIVKKHGKLRLCLDPSDLNKYILRKHFPLKTIEEIASRIKDSSHY